MVGEISINKKTEDIWIYQLEPANAMIGAILAALSALFFFLYAVENNMALSQDHYLFFIIIAVLISLLITKKKVLEINRRDKTINKCSQILFFKKNKIYPLDDFDSIKISPKTMPAEEGYLNTVYSLLLFGPDASIEILSFNNKEEAQKKLSELSAFLKLGTEN